jgi:hypothetical protein
VSCPVLGKELQAIPYISLFNGWEMGMAQSGETPSYLLPPPRPIRYLHVL